jgi:flagellar motor switch protein FliN/FliY
MTDVATVPLVADPTAVGDAVVAALPALPGLRVEPIAPGDVLPVPGEDARAVAVDLGAGARLVIAVSSVKAQLLGDDLVEACSPAVLAAAARSGTVPQAMVAEVDLRAAELHGDELAVAAALLDAEGAHAVTVAVIAPAATPTPDEAPAPVHEFAPLPDESAGGIGAGNLELLHDVSLGVTAELGRARMLVRDVLSLSPGSVIELDRAAGSPVDVLVNGTLIARGEVVVIDEEFGIRITEVLGYSDAPKP